MIKKAKNGYYVYTSPNRMGLRRRIGGPFPTKKAAEVLNRRTKKRGKKKRKK